MRPGKRQLLLAMLLLVLTFGFTALGVWQLERRTWKLALIAQVEAQLARPPVSAPGRAHWPDIGSQHVYQPVKLTGQFLHGKEALVQAMTRHGSGYWVLTPLARPDGSLVLVNRGFVDPAHRLTHTRHAPEEPVLVSGLLRLTEPHGRTLQPNRPAQDRWYSRDVAAIGAARGLPAAELAPYFVDALPDPKAAPWPIAGLTVTRFRNAHLGYALTWFALALMTLGAGWIAIVNRRRP